MHVYEIGSATFDRFADDLVARLDALNEKRPLIWVAIGNSGSHVIQAIVKRVEGSPLPWLADVNVVQLGWDPTRRSHQLQDPSDEALLGDAAVLLVDSVVNSGETMLGALEFLNSLARRPRSIIAYAIAVRQNAEFVPNLFSIAMGSSDRVFLPWHAQRPNNRLTMRGVYRSLREADLVRPSIKSGQDFMDRVLWRDRWYSLKREAHRRILVCEIEQQIAAFISFTVDLDARELHVDEIASDLAHAGQGIAGALLRYAETLARGAGCTFMSLWAHQSVVKFYEERGFQLRGPKIGCGSDGEYVLMVRALGSSKVDIGSLAPAIAHAHA